jgi:hypothetical protein
MTPYPVADHRGYHFGQEQTEWPAFNNRQEYCGQIRRISSWAVPAKIYLDLRLSNNHIDMYLTPEGHWASTLEYAELLSRTEPPTEFFVRGAILGLFVPGEWAEENGTPNTYGDYRVFRRKSGGWDAEEVEDAPPVLAGAADYF